MGMSKKLLEAFKLFDEANAKDPNTEHFEGAAFPKELLYAKRMTDILNDFEPSASEALQLTARCQHICRWEIPRESYEMNRAGYLKWRQELKKFHAEKASSILHKVGYDEDTIDRVSFLLLKKQLKKDGETQTLEDVICLVFLKYYYEPFLAKHDDDKIISILQKTWKKMSEKGHKAALGLSYSDRGLELVTRAISN
ncbi:DUF4202 domain-containing protein [Muricauda oceani]|uniref:DUF4202 domain-containing protein n=1 Tax=Flagellimonas oceani TaxID=2698672 RepID=A0A6G7IZH2_9FLAO|nr:DUF4202 domain-containing protein [Allomuricauda oceani]MBW8243629.1 DUF4202 domain-containing protein [Allomuricauda oceani]QII44003.1 DUF4202 domain-containing protein [Allomuricauda oceani]